YLLLGAAPIEGRFSGVVDIPNACATVYLPVDILEIDIRPGSGEVPKIDPGIGAPRASVG
ncbi:MAG: formamidase, partial [Pseudoxanthomonas suwonensis]